MRNDELLPPLIDLRYKENNDNGDILRDDDNHDMHVPDRIIVNDSTITPILPTDEDNGNDDDDRGIQVDDETNTMDAPPESTQYWNVTIYLSRKHAKNMV